MPVIKEIGGFDTTSITEDLELAVKIRSHGYTVKSCPHSITFTNAPVTLKAFWRQRVRWFRGYIDTHKKYKHLIGNKMFGPFGWFQLPFNMISPLILLVAFIVMVYNVTKGIYYFVYRTLFIDGYLASLLESFPTLKDYMLTLQLDILVPIVATVLVGLLMVTLAFRFIDDKMVNPFALLLYLFTLPIVTMFQWIWAIALEVRRAENKW